MATKEQMKERAIEYLHKLGVYERYVRAFEEDGKVCFFEGYGGFYVYQEPEIEAKMKEIEEEYGSMVYAITHEKFEFGECWTFLYVSKHEEEWEYDLEKVGKITHAFSYVWNADDDLSSEFGSVGIHSCFGGIARVY